MSRSIISLVALALAFALPIEAAVYQESGDAGAVPDVAQDVALIGPLDALNGRLATAFDVDLYRIRIDDPTTFSARALIADSPAIDPQLYLFNEWGQGVVANDNRFGSKLPLIPLGSLQSQHAGTYLLGVSAFDNDPHGPFNSMIFPNDTTGVVVPQGPTQFYPLTGWSRSVTAVPGNYAIELTGASPFNSIVPRAYYSLEGWFANGSEMETLFFNVDSEIIAVDSFSLRTWHYGGGTNAAGDVIEPGGFDPVLRLFDATSGGSLIWMNDDYQSVCCDSQITWNSASPEYPPNGLTVPLDPGDYRMEMTSWSGNLSGRQPNWAVDLVGPANKMVLTGAEGGIGTSVLKSLKFGAPNFASDGQMARVEISSGESLAMSGDLVIREGGYLSNQGLIAASRVVIEPNAAGMWLDGGIVSTSELVLDAGLTGTGAVILSPDGWLQNRYAVLPGDWMWTEGTGWNGEAGAITIPSGNYAQSAAGSLYVLIGGVGPTQFSQLLVFDGLAALDGGLHVEFADIGAEAYVPHDGDEFEIITAAYGFSGEFDLEQSEFPSLNGMYWEIDTPSETSLVLRIRAFALLGDYNDDGIVDAADYTVWRNNLGQNITLPNEDPNQTAGWVTEEDYAVWRAHYGDSNPSGGSILREFLDRNSAVPEPATSALLLAVGLTLVSFLCRATLGTGGR